jgi:outer membrane murein-binding lipoprotein Lpp
MEDLLTKLRLERFIAQFQEEEIDLKALSLFHEKDFLDLGVPKGPRVKIMRALEGIFADDHEGRTGGGGVSPDIEELQARVNVLQSTVDDLAAAAGMKAANVGYSGADVCGLQTKVDDLSRVVDEVSEQLSAMREDFDRVAEHVTGTAVELAQVVEQSKQAPIEFTGQNAAIQQPITVCVSSNNGAGTHEENLDLAGHVDMLSQSLRLVQELVPSRLCWSIRNAREKLSGSSPGKCMRAPAFALCGTIVGMKLEFYPAGRGRTPDASDERTLPEITPRRGQAHEAAHRPANGRIPDENPCSIGICCPMGVKMQYHLQIGRAGLAFDSCHVQWTTVYHDTVLRWRDALEHDNSLTIVVTCLKLHNRHFKVAGDTVFVSSD